MPLLEELPPKIAKCSFSNRREKLKEGILEQRKKQKYGHKNYTLHFFMSLKSYLVIETNITPSDPPEKFFFLNGEGKRA